MMAQQLPEPIGTALQELETRLRALYGECLEQRYLYGSYARGSAGPESDVDVLVVLRGPLEPGREIARMTPAVSDVSLAHDLLIAAVPVPSDWTESRWNPFLVQVRKEAIRL